jgi:LPXTG-motif cell wall-anchored protein
MITGSYWGHREEKSVQGAGCGDEPVVALKEAPVTAVKPTGEEVEIAQVVMPPPAQQKETADATERMEQLPQTASQLPLLGLIGLLSLGAGLALMGISKRTS